MILLNILLGILVHAHPAFSQVPDSLPHLIKEGIEQNLVLKQRKISLENSLLALKVSKSYFLPTTSFSGNYTTANGGRAISIPIGDLLNPVYKSLNQLTQSNNYDPVQNQRVNFLPNNYYDVRLHTSLNIYNADLNYAKKIQSEWISISQSELDIYKRELVYEIKSAYFQYLNAHYALGIYQSGLGLVEKNLDLNQSLLKNGKGLPANILRIKGEREIVLAQLEEARVQEINARAYFNFLLNRDLHQEIPLANFQLGPSGSPDSLVADIGQREELKEIQYNQHVQQFSLDMKKAFWKPKINAFLDLGSQNSDFVVNSKSIFYLTGVQIDIPIFTGKRNTYAIQLGKLSVNSANLNLDYITSQLKLSALMAENEVKASYHNYQGSKAQFTASKSYFHLLDRGFREGTNTLLEFLDARNQLTASEIQMNLRFYDYLKAQAHLERETAAYSF